MAATVPKAKGKLILKAELTSVVAPVALDLPEVNLVELDLIEAVALALTLPSRSSCCSTISGALSNCSEVTVGTCGRTDPKTGS